MLIFSLILNKNQSFFTNKMERNDLATRNKKNTHVFISYLNNDFFFVIY